ncbi:hypothetical protein WR25_26372 [Diploscapter pachys]|uniref:Proteasome activator Blm10 middle HEAT repeats region domain-containing protein n=1 Tax=Diploscapter pachys TaxID=2018661 RepID=A0A2A2JI89_9BILA|nr:hypothetical protein WR25_26372 [Diploscapter pachys]
MSESEDEISLSGSDSEDPAAEEIDNEEMIIEDEPPTSDGDDAMSESQSPARQFQKEFWQHRFLPYYSDLESQANRYLSEIKAGLAHSIALNDPQVGFIHWTLELERYIDLYGKRFSKEDHVNFVKIYLPFVVKGSIWRNTKISIHALNMLIGKRDYLMRGDLIIDWRPLYELYVEVAYKNLEEDGIFLMPDGFKSELYTLIFYARNYFSDSATQELLDELRPLICIWDESIIRAWKLLDLFLPMNMTPDLHPTIGSGLWFEEAWHWFTVPENNSLIDPNILKLFGRLSYECPNLIDWTDKLDMIFTKMIRSLHLGKLDGMSQSLSFEQFTMWITYMLGSKCHDALIHHLKSVLELIEDFLHPSNHGDHSQYLLSFIQKFSHNVVLRVKRERNEKSNKPKTTNKIPPEMRLTQKHLDELAELFVPSLKLAIFTKVRNEFVSPIYRNFGSFAPKIIIPAVLEMVYPALETLTEPHRLIQSLTVLLGVLIPLVRDQPDAQGRSMRIHAVTLLNQLLPGLDRNDIAKCMATYQLAGVLLNLVILVDCSDAVHLRDDLTEEERELCSATANFESIITMIIDRMFTMLIDCGQSASSSGLHSGISTKETLNLEDSILHRGTISVYRAICRNTGSALFKVAADLVYNFVVENVYDSKTCADAVADLIHVTVKSSPETQFKRFMKLILDRLQSVMTPEVYLEEKVDFNVIWWMTMASRVVKVTGKTLVDNWDEVKKMLDLVMPLMKCSQAAEKTTKIMDNVLEALTSVYLVVGVNRRAQFDQPLEQYLPIRHWANHLDKKTYKPVWNIPTNESIQRAEQVFKGYVMPHIEALKTPEGRDKREILHRLLVIRHAVNGASFSLPMLEGPDVPLSESPVHHWDESAVIRTKDMPEMSLDGKHIRQSMFDCVKPLMDYLLRTTEDDYKSIHEAVHLLHQLVSNRGLDKGQHQQMLQNYRVTKMALTDKVSGNKFNIDLLAEEFISLLHKKRIITKSGYIFKQQHMEFYDMLIDVSTSHYSQNRQRAQSVLQAALREHPYSYKKVLDRILGYLDPSSNATHEQLKGALYMLVDGRRAAIVLRMDYESQLKIWPAIVRTRHSDKPSIISLLDLAQNTIVENYESYRMKYEASFRKYSLLLI